MSDDVKAKLGTLFERIADVKEDVAEVRVRVSQIEQAINTLQTQGQIQNKILEQQYEQLAEHIRRTNLLEERVEQVAAQIRAELKPVEDHVQFLNRLGKLVSWVVAIAVGVLAVIKFFQG